MTAVAGLGPNPRASLSVWAARKKPTRGHLSSEPCHEPAARRASPKPSHPANAPSWGLPLRNWGSSSTALITVRRPSPVRSPCTPFLMASSSHTTCGRTSDIPRGPKAKKSRVRRASSISVLQNWAKLGVRLIAERAPWPVPARFSASPASAPPIRNF